jgi:hypothetical protein
MTKMFPMKVLAIPDHPGGAVSFKIMSAVNFTDMDAVAEAMVAATVDSNPRRVAPWIP